LQEGGIWLSTDNSIFPYRTIVKGKEGDIQEVVAAQFDPTGYWLAFIRGDRVSVWQADKEKLYLEEDMINAVNLRFDRTGQRLIVAASDKIVIWDLEGKNKIVEYDAPGISALSISDDNRLLIWGDTQGRAHIWGAPLP
jgi:WD40 repeat protein